MLESVVPPSLEVALVHIVVLVKPVPVVGTERLSADHAHRADDAGAERQ